MVIRFRSLGRLLLVAGVAVSVAGCNFARLKANRAFTQGNEEYATKQYREAIEQYQAVLDSMPEQEIAQDDVLSSVWFFLGNSYENLYKPALENDPDNQELAKQAVRNYEIASKQAKDPQYRKLALQWLFGLYGPDKMDRPDEAVRIGKGLIASDPDEVESYLGLARHYRSIGDPEAAVATLEQALKRSPDDINVIGELADTYAKDGKFDDAIEQLERVADLQPEDPEARLRLAVYYQEWIDQNKTLSPDVRGEYIERGIEATDVALKVRPDYFDAFVYKRILLNFLAEQTKDRKEYDAIMKRLEEIDKKVEEIQPSEGATQG
ncbi:MAG: tetratricopeptide repeat protein [Luteitalea sp.]|nr:tetratricopeptide repeat protein [Luteitalea sp.]